MCLDTTQLLQGLSQGNRGNVEQLFEHVYAELKAIAASKLKAERPGHTLQPTALVNELYLRMVDQTRVNWRDRSHFMSIAATVMRRVLIDYARSKGAEKRGGGRRAVQVDDLMCVSQTTSPADIVALSDCLDRLTALNERHARVVELKVFGGLSVEEMAEALGVSPATVKNDWRIARAWIGSQLSPNS
jgi:RNA polymerase sigma-70 factor, ECF subfamily